MGEACTRTRTHSHSHAAHTNIAAHLESIIISEAAKLSKHGPDVMVVAMGIGGRMSPQVLDMVRFLSGESRRIGKQHVGSRVGTSTCSLRMRIEATLVRLIADVALAALCAHVAGLPFARH